MWKRNYFSYFVKRMKLITFNCILITFLICEQECLQRFGPGSSFVSVTVFRKIKAIFLKTIWQGTIAICSREQCEAHRLLFLFTFAFIYVCLLSRTVVLFFSMSLPSISLPLCKHNTPFSLAVNWLLEDVRHVRGRVNVKKKNVSIIFLRYTSIGMPDKPPHESLKNLFAIFGRFFKVQPFPWPDFFCDI